MIFYTLVSVSKGCLFTCAATREEALAQFGKELGEQLTIKPAGHMADYMLDQWENDPHWIRAYIPVWKKMR